VVPTKCSELEFWDKFLKANYMYKTEIYDGRNPLFVPFKTNEKDYEDKYIHNPASLLGQQVERAKEEVKEKPLDVNYWKNTEMQWYPEGYGNYQKKHEVDSGELEGSSKA